MLHICRVVLEEFNFSKMVKKAVMEFCLALSVVKILITLVPFIEY